MAFVKLDTGILTSSIWAEDPATIKVWIYLLAAADPDGVVHSTVPGIAIQCGLSVEVVRDAVARFAAPDCDSRSSEHEGRRVRVEREPEFAIHIVNYGKYRRKDHTHAARQARYREQLKRREAVTASRDGETSQRDGVTASRAVTVRKQKQKPEAEGRGRGQRQKSEAEKDSGHSRATPHTGRGSPEGEPNSQTVASVTRDERDADRSNGNDHDSPGGRGNGNDAADGLVLRPADSIGVAAAIVQATSTLGKPHDATGQRIAVRYKDKLSVTATEAALIKLARDAGVSRAVVGPSVDVLTAAANAASGRR